MLLFVRECNLLLNFFQSVNIKRVASVLIACTLLTWVVFYANSEVSADNEKKPVVVYQQYNGTWYEFRYDWRDYRETPDDWESLDELKAWLEYDSVFLLIVADSNGRAEFNGQCEYAAFQARARAYAVGKWLDTEIITKQECIKYAEYLDDSIYYLGINDGHYLNKAVIGNSVYYVEVARDKVWLAYYLD